MRSPSDSAHYIDSFHWKQEGKTMRRINERTVVLNKHEQVTKDRFEELLDQGHGITAAARQALGEMPHHHRSHRFVEYLSDRTLTLHKGIVVAVRQAVSR